MSRYDVGVSATVPAPPALVYWILADYRQHHPRILPRRCFQRIEVETGGVGAGTRMRVEMRLLGALKEIRLAVSEPESGRVLAETDVDGASVTTFTVEPGPDGSRVTIKTFVRAAPGVRGAVERIVIPPVLRRLYRDELRLLAAYAADVAIAESCAGGLDSACRDLASDWRSPA